MGLTFRHAFLEFFYVDREFGARCQPDGFPVNLQLLSGKSRVEHRQSAAKRTPGAGLIVVGP